MELQELVADLTQQAKTMKQKMRVRKEDGEKLKEELANQKAKEVAAIASMKRSNQQLSTQLANKARKLDELQTVLKEAHGNQISELVDNNQKILQQQHELLQQLPSSLKVNSDLLADARRANSRITAEERVKFQKELTALEFGRTAEIQNVKQQYEFWLNKKQREAEKFVKDFNTYRNKKNERIGEYEAELMNLFDYSSSLKDIVDTMGRGGFNMRKTRSGFIPVIPKEFVVGDILDDQNSLGRTLRLVEKRRDALEHERTVQNRASKALSTVEGMFDGGVTQMQGTAARGLRATGGRPQSAGGRMGSAGRMDEVDDIWSRPPPATPVHRGDDDDATTVTGVEGGGSVMMNAEDEIDMDSNLEDLGESDLRDTVARFRKYTAGVRKGESMRKTVREELNSNETIGYIKHLEEEKQKYSGQVRDMSLKLKDLRIAYEALIRTGERKGGGKGGGAATAGGGPKNRIPRRPQSAVAGR